MSAFPYAQIAADASALITYAGQTVSFIAPGEPLQSDPWNGTVNKSTTSARGVIIPFVGRDGTFPASLVKDATSVCYCADSEVMKIPASGYSSIEIDGSSWRVVGCESYSPAGIPVLYIFFIAR
jgi:hypothetical protein